MLINGYFSTWIGIYIHGFTLNPVQFHNFIHLKNRALSSIYRNKDYSFLNDIHTEKEDEEEDEEEGKEEGEEEKENKITLAKKEEIKGEKGNLKR